MTLKSFQALRRTVLASGRSLVIADLGPRAFREPLHVGVR